MRNCSASYPIALEAASARSCPLRPHCFSFSISAASSTVTGYVPSSSVTPFALQILVKAGAWIPYSFKSGMEKTFPGVSYAICFPLCKSRMRSQYAASFSIFCSIIRIVIPKRVRVSTARKTSSLPSGSSCEVGSSKIITSGRMTSTLAMATRCICPPERSKGLRSRYCQISSSFKASSTRCFISSDGMARFCMPKATSS